MSPVRTATRTSGASRPSSAATAAISRERALEVLGDVDRERLQRRHVDDPRDAVDRLARVVRPVEAVDAHEEPGERLARAGGRGDQRVGARPRCAGQPSRLRRGGAVGEAPAEPLGDRRMEPREHGIRRGRASRAASPRHSRAPVRRSSGGRARTCVAAPDVLRPSAAGSMQSRGTVPRLMRVHRLPILTVLLVVGLARHPARHRRVPRPQVRGFDGTTLKVGGLGSFTTFPDADVGTRARLARANADNEVKGVTFEVTGYRDDGNSALDCGTGGDGPRRRRTMSSPSCPTCRSSRRATSSRAAACRGSGGGSTRRTAPTCAPRRASGSGTAGASRPRRAVVCRPRASACTAR